MDYSGQILTILFVQELGPQLWLLTRKDSLPSHVIEKCSKILVYLSFVIEFFKVWYSLSWRRVANCFGDVSTVLFLHGLNGLRFCICLWTVNWKSNLNSHTCRLWERERELSCTHASSCPLNPMGGLTCLLQFWWIGGVLEHFLGKEKKKWPPWLPPAQHHIQIKWVLHP